MLDRNLGTEKDIIFYNINNENIEVMEQVRKEANREVKRNIEYYNTY